jgi:hypothetical protein
MGKNIGADGATHVKARVPPDRAEPLCRRFHAAATRCA